MKIKYEIDSSLPNDEIIVQCCELSDKILQLDRCLNAEQIVSVFGTKNNKIFPIKPPFIEQIYSENRKTIIITKGESFESNKTLSEYEHLLGESFVRISKSVIVNIKHIKSIEAEFSGNFTLILISGNKTILSRTYVKSLKSAIGLE